MKSINLSKQCQSAGPSAFLISRGLVALISLLAAGLVAADDKAAPEKAKAPGERAEPSPPAGKNGDQRPPGGDGSMFFRVFTSRNDKNGDGVIEKSEFRGGGDRFDQMDKNKNGKLDRAEIDELHRSRMADPLSMRQRIERGETRRPPVDLPIAPPSDSKDGEAGPENGEPTALTPLGTRITAKQAFARLDVDEDGKVTATEFQRSPGMGDPKRAAEVVAKVDRDEDGSLSFDEFNRVFSSRHGAKPATKPAPEQPAPASKDK